VDRKFEQTGILPTCGQWRARFQDYLDGTLPREVSLELFLHVRDCDGCRLELEDLRGLIGRLESLPPVTPPPSFDDRILAAIPYEAYRQMEPIRRDRVPVFLQESFLPAFVRSPLTRAGGGALAVLLVAALTAGWVPDLTALLLPVPLAPELLVRVQRHARKRRVAGERSGS
jgi:anti-sigma factor RsiW